MAIMLFLLLLSQRIQELAVIARPAQSFDNWQNGFVTTTHCIDHAPQSIDLRKRFGIQQFLLGTCATTLNIKRREDTPFGQLAAKHQLHIAGAFELFVNHIIHTAAGIDKTGGNNR